MCTKECNSVPKVDMIVHLMLRGYKDTIEKYGVSEDILNTEIEKAVKKYKMKINIKE